MNESHNMDISFESNLDDTTREKNPKVLDTSTESVESQTWGQSFTKGCFVALLMCISVYIIVIYHMYTHFILPYKFV
jgi:hypothetical protein